MLNEVVTYVVPVLCKNCEYMSERCSLVGFRITGNLQSCPYIGKPVINSYGGVLNPLWNEIVYISGYCWIGLYPEQLPDNCWKVRWMLSLNGVGSCGAVKSDLYVLAFRKAREEALNQTRLPEILKQEFWEMFKRRLEGDLSGFKFCRQGDQVHKDTREEEIPTTEPYVSPFDDFNYGAIGDQLELFG